MAHAAMLTTATRSCGASACQAARSRRVHVCYATASPALPAGSSHGDSRFNRQRSDTSVFQLSANTAPTLSLNDVRDAYEACSTACSASERRQCFEVYGLDADKVDRYYERVMQMERLIDQGDSVGQNLVTSGGAFVLYFMAYCIVKV